MKIETEVKILKKDPGSEIFPNEDHNSTLLIQKLSSNLMKKRVNPRNYRKFESDIQYFSYPDIFPNKLSELLFDSLLCLQAIEKMENYQINFSSFHSFFPFEKKCKVNLVGCLIAIRYRINYSLDVMPYLFPASISCKFQALARFEEGNLKEALAQLFSELPDDLPPRFKITSYKDSPESYKLELRSFIEKLEEFNL